MQAMMIRFGEGMSKTLLEIHLLYIQCYGVRNFVSHFSLLRA
jgi:hypothetical protein